MLSLASKVAIITGASRGIGKAIALRLAREKVNLVLVARQVKLLSDVEEIASREGIRTRTLEVDLNDPLNYSYVVKTAVQEFGQIDFLINNAGAAINKPIEDSTLDDWQYLMNVNARAPFFLCKEAIPVLEKSNCPAIVNISSVMGRKGYANQSVYAASKHALTGFTKVLAQEVQSKNIRVHLLAPGGVDTDMVSSMRPDIERSDLIKPEEIAEWVAFLLKNQGNAMVDEINLRRFSSSPWA